MHVENHYPACKRALIPNSNSSPKWPSDTVSQNIKIQASTEKVPGEIRN